VARRRAGSSDLQIELTEKLIVWAFTGVKVFAFAFAVSLAYILYGVYGGHLRGAIEPRIMSNLQLMGQIMALSGGMATICLVVVTMEEVAFAVVAGLLGLAMIFGFPLLVAGQVDVQGETAAELIMRWASVTGKFIVLVVAFRLLMEIINYFRDAPQRQARLTRIESLTGDGQKTKTGSRPWWRLQHCWETPYCHDAIKEVCPAFKARKNCWRIHQGCNCDSGMIEALIRSGAASRGKGVTAEKKGTQEEYMRADLEGGIKIGQGERTRECRDCPIFLEHQRQTFKMVNPIVTIAAIVGLLAAYPIMKQIYQLGIQGMSKLASRLAFGASVSVSDWIGRLDTQTVWVFFYIIVGLLVMSYVLKFVEWAILIRKL